MAEGTVCIKHGCPPDTKGTDNFTFLHLETASKLRSHSFTSSTLLPHDFTMKLSHSLFLPILTLGNALDPSLLSENCAANINPKLLARSS
jgi:hypothetical protein